jgi:hypothetical protein
MRVIFILLLLGLSLKASPQVVKAEYFFDDAAVAYGQGISLTVPSNTGDAQITGDLPVTSLSPGFHQVFFRVKDAIKGWSPLTPKSFLKPNAHEIITGFKYCIDTQEDVNSWIYTAFPSPSSDVSMDVDFSLPDLSPGFHQIFFQAEYTSREWSPITPKTFIKPWPLETIVGFRYCIDGQPGTETWSYRAFPAPSTNVSMDFELDLGTLSKGIHYFEAMAKSENGIWTAISGGTFFNIYSEPIDITALEYYFEDENGVASSLFSVNNFTHSPNVTLDSVTFSIPVSSLENLKKYFVYIRAVDEERTRSFYAKDTIVYHTLTTGIKDLIYLTPELMVFPNPVSEMVNLKFVPLNYSGEFIISVFDGTGRIVAEEKFSFSEADHYVFDASALISGVYRIAICTTAGKPVARATFVKK